MLGRRRDGYEFRLLAHFDVRAAATLCLKLRDLRTRTAQDASSQFDPKLPFAPRWTTRLAHHKVFSGRRAPVEH